MFFDLDLTGRTGALLNSENTLAKLPKKIQSSQELGYKFTPISKHIGLYQEVFFSLERFKKLNKDLKTKQKFLLCAQSDVFKKAPHLKKLGFEFSAADEKTFSTFNLLQLKTTIAITIFFLGCVACISAPILATTTVGATLAFATMSWAVLLFCAGFVAAATSGPYFLFKNYGSFTERSLQNELKHEGPVEAKGGDRPSLAIV